MELEAEVEVDGEAEVEEGLEADLEAEVVAEIVKQRPKKNLRTMGLKVEANIKTEKEEKVAGDHMIKEEFSATIVKNTDTILMSVGRRIDQRRGKKEKKQIWHKRKEMGLIQTKYY